MGKYIVHKSAEDFSKMLNLSIMICFVLMLMGGLVFFLSNLTTKVIGYICAIACFINAYNIANKFFKRQGAKLYRYNLIFSIILICLGLLLFLIPYSVDSFVTVIFGMYLMTIGGNKINYSMWFKFADDRSWFLTFMIGLLLIIFGFMVIINPFNNLVMNQLVGVFLLFSSILDLTDTIMLKNRAESVVKIFW